MDDRIWQAIHLFNICEWYAAHDALEELWHESELDDRCFFHGLIQIAVAEHHLTNGNRNGALLLMAEGLNHLQRSDPQNLGYDLTSLVLVVQERLFMLQSGRSPQDLPLPELKPLALEKD